MEDRIEEDIDECCLERLGVLGGREEEELMDGSLLSNKTLACRCCCNVRERCFCCFCSVEKEPVVPVELVVVLSL
jgi:hypothetical protein